MNRSLLILSENKSGYVPILENHLARSAQSTLRWCKNAKEALRWYRREKPGLIITDLAIAKDEETSIDFAEMRGLSLIQEIWKTDQTCRVIFLVDSVPPDARQLIQIIRRCRVIEAGVSWETALDAVLEEWFPAVSQTPQISSSKRAKITIHLNLKDGYAEYSMASDLFSVSMTVLEVSALDVQQLASFSDIIDLLPNEKWPDYLQYIRRDLKDNVLMSAGFLQNYQSLLACVRDESHIDIQFVVEPVAHPIILEAASDRPDNYWMLQSPVSRSLLAVQSRRTQPFRIGQSRAGLRCLIIDANASGPLPNLKDSGGKPLRLEEIDTATETKRVQGRLKRAGLEVDVLHLKKTDRGVVAKMKGALGEDSWDMVHYVGHSYFRSNGLEASAHQRSAEYVFLPGRLSPKPMKVSDFAQMVRKAGVRFVYMSSCYSSQFAFALAAHDIPSSVGFRWHVESGHAADMADRFYEHLMQADNSLQMAFFNARRDLKEEYPDDRIWAAPVLINQGG